MRTLTLAAILLAFLASGYTCTARRNILEIPLTGTYGGSTITAAESRNGIPATVSATHIGFEICYPARRYVQYDWVDTQVATESTHGEEAVAWASGAGTYDQGQPAVLGCFSAHEIHWQWDRQYQDAEGDPTNDWQEGDRICVILTGDATGEQFMPCIMT